ncbi:hypothetical protein [Leptospira biflexa]|uniref:hypothetical protein n=1 Tax=Leptospira biflexa TaxID=172 RepID=UPI0002DCB277|nr:hypothetical protein [Leptospira biflexa]
MPGEFEPILSAVAETKIPKQNQPKLEFGRSFVLTLIGREVQNRSLGLFGI